jgi:ribosomal protein S12 methylthiotransferase
VQQEISRDVLVGRVGREIDVLVDEADGEGAIGRSAWDAPEIDGSVFLNGEVAARPGDLVRARVVHGDSYDMWAERVGS